MIFGGGHQFDPELNRKINKAFGGKPSAQQRVDKFLDEIGLDPRMVPFNVAQAKKRINVFLADEEGTLIFDGNSLGLKSITRVSGNLDCPHCGSGDTEEFWPGDKAPDPTHDRYCHDCEQSFVQPPGKVEVIDEYNPDRVDLEKAYVALLPEFGHSFKCTYNYADPDIESIDEPIPSLDPTTYPTGTLLKVERYVLGEEGDPVSEVVTIRVGGPFNDTDLVRLADMRPIDAPETWKVTEVL